VVSAEPTKSQGELAMAEGILANDSETDPVSAKLAAGYHDPAWLVRCAWSTFRLKALQQLVGEVIAELAAMEPREFLGHTAGSPDPARLGPDPALEAQQACSDELRDACGMVDAEAQRAIHCRLVRDYMAEQPVAWSEAFAEALDKYRHAASAALRLTLQATPRGLPEAKSISS
ncbi:MAG TPA: hypothetical protein VG963_12110, partial [Polyangiaceae bacterium]|nr:hypothetical protein [Polyangiaceae bacterium]